MHSTGQAYLAIVSQLGHGARSSRARHGGALLGVLAPHLAARLVQARNSLQRGEIYGISEATLILTDSY